MGEELRKQLIDQPLHFLWGFGAGSFLISSVLFATNPWTLGMMFISVGACWFWTRRERLQFRNGAHVSWDPPLDNAVYWIGFLAGCMLGSFLGGTT